MAMLLEMALRNRRARPRVLPAGLARAGGVLLALPFIAFAVMAVAVRLVTSTRPGWLRQFNRRVLNPAMLRKAGQPGWYAALVHHVGRRTGRAYATPLVAIPTDRGFLVPLTYGTGVDWLENLRAAGGGSVQRDGRVYAVGSPEILTFDQAAPDLAWGRRLVFGLYGMRLFARLPPAPGSPGGSPEPATRAT